MEPLPLVLFFLLLLLIAVFHLLPFGCIQFVLLIFPQQFLLYSLISLLPVYCIVIQIFSQQRQGVSFKSDMTLTTVVDIPFELSSLVEVNLVFSLILPVQNILFLLNQSVNLLISIYCLQKTALFSEPLYYPVFCKHILSLII